MKKIINLSFALLLLMSSCNNNNEEITTISNEFVNAMHKPVNFEKMTELYDGFALVSVHRVDKHRVFEIQKEGDSYIVTVQSSFKVSNGDELKNDFQLRLKNIEGHWKIVNSKGLGDIKSNNPEIYDYAIENNIIKNEKSTWDLEILTLLKEAKKTMKK